MIPTPVRSTEAAAYAAHRRALNAAVNFVDNDLTPDAQLRRRRSQIEAAHAALAAATPQAPEPSTSRAAALAGLAPATADELALLGRERDKVTALLAQGDTLAQVIASADERRLVAILDNTEILPEVLASGDRAAAADDVRGEVFDRLVQLGHPTAVQAAQEETVVARTQAWHDALTQARTGPVEYATMAALHTTDLAGYSEAFTDDSAVDWNTVTRVIG